MIRLAIPVITILLLVMSITLGDLSPIRGEADVGDLSPIGPLDLGACDPGPKGPIRGEADLDTTCLEPTVLGAS